MLIHGTRDHSPACCHGYIGCSSWWGENWDVAENMSFVDFLCLNDAFVTYTDTGLSFRCLAVTVVDVVVCFVVVVR